MLAKINSVERIKADARKRRGRAGLLNLFPFGDRGFESHPRRCILFCFLRARIAGIQLTDCVATKEWRSQILARPYLREQKIFHQHWR